MAIKKKKKTVRAPIKKEFTYRGKTVEELKAMPLKDFLKLLTSRERRTVARGMSDEQKKLLEKLKKKDFVKTHEREMVVLPEMVEKKIGIHNGKEFVSVDITDEMIGHRLGEFAQTRRTVKHSGPGMGATRSSKFVPLK